MAGLPITHRTDLRAQIDLNQRQLEDIDYAYNNPNKIYQIETSSGVTALTSRPEDNLHIVK